MSEQNNNNQTPSSDDQNRQPTGQQGQQQQGQQQGQQPTGQQTSGSQSETGEAEGGAAATGQSGETDTLSPGRSADRRSSRARPAKSTGENAGGFVASKDKESGDYLQERGEKSGESDIEGSSNFGTNGE